MAKVAINGMGRIGRAVLKVILDTPERELAGLNDLIPPDNLAYLLKYDSVPRASVVDLNMTLVIDEDLLKVMSWYDNEWGYANQMVREAVQMIKTS